VSDVNELLNWLRKNLPEETDDINILEQHRTPLADAFDLKPTHRNIGEAFEKYLVTPRSFRRTLRTVEIANSSLTADTIWIEDSKKRGRHFWERLRRFLAEERKRPEASMRRLDDESETILKYLGNPCLPACRRHGLVVGYIQSGKTANMAALMAKAADAGYKIIIVFAGILNTLRQQTQLRFDRELTGGDQGTWTNNWKNLPHVELWKQNERKNFSKF